MQLVPFDANNPEHVHATYDILKARFQNDDRINIDRKALPSVEEHVSYITSGRYKYYYISICNGIIVGIIYIIAHNNEFGTFLHLKNARKVYKECKDTLDKSIGTIDVNGRKVTKMVYYFGLLSFRTLLEKHPDLKKITARVKYNNNLSRQFAEFGYKFKPKYIYYEYE